MFCKVALGKEIKRLIIILSVSPTIILGRHPTHRHMSTQTGEHSPAPIAVNL